MKGEKSDPNIIVVKRLPNPECRRCRGEGNLGRNGITGQIVPCSCVTRQRGNVLTSQDLKYQEKRNILKQMFEIDDEIEKNKEENK